MKRTTLALALCSLALPITAIAMMNRSSELMTFLANAAGHPRDFEAKVYLRAAADDGTPVHIFGTVRGSGEGSTPQDAKLTMHMSIDASLSEGTVAAGFDVLAYQGKMYGKLSNITATGNAADAGGRAVLAEVNKKYAEQWFVFDASDASGDPQRFWRMLEGDESASLMQADVQELFNALVDAAFAMEVTRYRAGYAYLLTQKSDALSQIVRVLAQSELGGGVADLASVDWNDPELLAVQEELNRSLTVRFKADVSNEGILQFARSFITFALPEEHDLFFSLEGSMHNRTKPVYVSVPTDAIPIENIIDADLLPFDIPSRDAEDDGQGEGDEQWEDEQWETLPDEGTRPLPRAVPAVTCASYGSVRGADLEPNYSVSACPGGRESRRALRQRVERNIHR